MRRLAVTIALITSLVIPGSLIGQRRDCRETGNPKHIPSASTLIDSAAALGQVAVLNEPSDTMIFSVFFSDSDSIPRVRAVLGADAIAAVALARFVRPQKPDLWGIRMRIVKGASRALTLERVLSTRAPTRRPRALARHGGTATPWRIPAVARTHSVASRGACFRIRRAPQRQAQPDLRHERPR